MKIVMVSAPGSGKGSIAGVLQEDWQIPHIAVGDILRDNVQRHTALGEKIDNLIKGGSFVDDDTINTMMLEALTGRDDYILDGFPRTVPQTHFYLANLPRPDFVVCLDVPKPILIKRMLNRGRSDDTEETICKRLAIYDEVTAPVLGCFDPALVLHVEGAATIAESAHNVKNAVHGLK
jgi:adenylate kinase